MEKSALFSIKNGAARLAPPRAAALRHFAPREELF